MKTPSTSFFGIFLVIAVFASLSCWTMIRRSSISSSDAATLSPVIDATPTIAFNKTLLSYAAIEIGEDTTRKEINTLLKANYPHAMHRSISSWGQDHHEKEYVRPTRIPVQLMNPKYFPLWKEFRQLLRNWVMKKRFQPDIMTELVSLIKVPVDLHHGFPQTDKAYASCAVVGNSGVLLKKKFGDLIDSHEVVIRLNNAKILHFEQYVGRKTNISFVNSNILHLCARRPGCFCHPYGEDVPIVMYICQAVHFMDFSVCNRSHKAPLIITDARFDMLCARIVKYYSLKRFVEMEEKPLEEWSAAHDGNLFHYSSGMQAITLAVGLCEKVSIFGFGKSSDAKHHYHTNQKKELHLHDYGAEYDFYHDLIKQPESVPFLRDSNLKIPPVVMYN